MKNPASARTVLAVAAQLAHEHGAHLLAWLLSLSRTPEPSRVPQPVRPDAPSRLRTTERPPATRSAG